MTFLRYTVKAFAAAAVLLAAPAISNADISVVVQETTSTGTAVGASQTFTQVGNSTNFVVSPLSTAGFSGITIVAGPSAGGLTTTVIDSPTSAYTPGDKLSIVVTESGITNPYPAGSAGVMNNAGASAALSGGQNVFSSQTQLLGPTSTPLVPSTTTATSTSPSVGQVASPAVSVPVIPSSFSIQQSITDTFVPSAGSSLSGNGGGTASSTVTLVPAPVPAPAGLALALIGLPVLGYRRYFRKVVVS